MVSKVSGRVTDVSFLQSLKAPSPILVTPEGSAIFDTSLFSKADFPMLFRVDGRTYSLVLEAQKHISGKSVYPSGMVSLAALPP